MNNCPNDLIPIGRVVKPHGIKGQIKIRFYNESSKVLEKDSEIWLKKKDDRNSDFKFFKIGNINYNSLDPIVTLINIDNRSNALEIKDCIIYFSRLLFSNKDKEDSIYFVDFIGCKIYDSNKTFVGIAKDIVHFPGNNHVMIIEGESKEFMIPIQTDLIKLFDVNEKYVVIDIIDGLIN